MKWFHIKTVPADGLVHLTNDLVMLIAYVHSRANEPEKVGFACDAVAYAVRSIENVTCLECIARAR